ncbi:tetratricopeptide repeat protein [Mesorhizobium sp. WSM4303]|uniref:winged helix-turn-helix domain-containing tetratricopeptide repeat protein n=1 Tax=unclassified Mesorhizobium TaxID=325217 RepID=UPI00115DBC3B|nr:MULTISPECIES: winged helix-turn-helix domain-containing protein [unclassified Mesorhizobium]TRC96730.1 tetratricopeptide repeat protein [Mesorhizobium sp. WSM4306]TRD08405.1 tetratricopeptide repeat protein [Mesorhizobium sp. WSM4303]
MTATAADQVFRFGGFTLDLAMGTLRGINEPLFLRPKAYALLSHLARNMGRVVPKSELMDVVWPGVYVTEDSLTQSVREIRKVLGDDMVRTVSKRGYMLAAEAQTAPEIGAQPVVAVVRFRNESGDPADEAMVDGFAEDLINGVARFGTVTVLARNSSFSFASFGRSEWPEVRARIGANYLVEGSLRRQGEHVVVAVSLVDIATARQLWGDRFQSQGDGLFAIEREIVEQIVSRLVTRVTNAGLEQASRKPVTSLAAYELLLRGFAMLRDPAQTDQRSAEILFEAAIAKDPGYGLAYTYLALVRALDGEFGRANDAVLENARDLAEKGLALSPDQPTGHRVQSLIRLYMREHEAAEQHMRIALQLNPCDADCIEQMGMLLTMRGRPLEALTWLARGIRIDPLHPHWYQFDRALALYMMGEYRQAADALELATRPAPWIRTRLAACYAQLGEMEKARRQIALIEEGAPFSPIDYALRGVPFENTADAEHLAEGVRLALGETQA